MIIILNNSDFLCWEPSVFSLDQNVMLFQFCGFMNQVRSFKLAIIQVSDFGALFTKISRRGPGFTLRKIEEVEIQQLFFENAAAL